jgi:predicted amidophosphoribosyltransferase
MVKKYNNINIGESGDFFYLEDYVPKNKKTASGEDALGHSEYILKYKKGDPRIIAFFVKILNNIIYNYFYFYDLILPVPPSNSYLDVYPNAIACSYLSALGTISTLEKAIVCYKGHKPGHIEGIESKKNDLMYISVTDKYDFEYKNIIILDDIITTGTTFAHIKDALLKRGANSVAGLFLGRTRSACGFMKEDING